MYNYRECASHPSSWETSAQEKDHNATLELSFGSYTLDLPMPRSIIQDQLHHDPDPAEAVSRMHESDVLIDWSLSVTDDSAGTQLTKHILTGQSHRAKCPKDSERELLYNIKCSPTLL